MLLCSAQRFRVSSNSTAPASVGVRSLGLADRASGVVLDQAGAPAKLSLSRDLAASGSRAVR
jgi:hypothetical protein